MMNKNKLLWNIFIVLFFIMLGMHLYNIFVLGKIPNRWKKYKEHQGCSTGFCG
jgi:hypothetical protein